MAQTATNGMFVVPNPSERERLLLEKLKRCEIVYEFTGANVNRARIEEKRRLLLQILETIASNRTIITRPVGTAILDMVAANLFHPLYIKRTFIPSRDQEDEGPPQQPSWPHLKLVYEVLRRFVIAVEVDVRILKSYIPPKYMCNLIDRFSSEDNREREILKVIVHRIYGKVMSLRGLVRRVIQQRFYAVTFEKHHYNGTGELLEIVGSIINGYAEPVKEEHIKFLQRTLLPLHKCDWMKYFNMQLTFCITQFLAKRPDVSPKIIKALLKYWPDSNSRKTVLFLDELEAVLEHTRPDLFKQVRTRVFQKIAQCIASPHFLVAERGLLLWKNDYVIQLIIDSRDVVVPLVYECLLENIETHWNTSVISLSSQVREMLRAIDYEICDRCEDNFREKKAAEEKEAEARETRVDEMQRSVRRLTIGSSSSSRS